MAARKRHHGHYCWVCGRMRPNEKFSGRNHARHICKECARLGSTELNYRQAICNLNRLMGYGTMIPRKKRRQFNQYLIHENERVRAYALEIETADALERAELRALCDLGEVFLELAMDGPLAPLEGEVWQDDNSLVDTEIPF